MLKTRASGLLPSAVHTWGWAYVHNFDFAYAGLTMRMWAANQRKLLQPYLSIKVII